MLQLVTLARLILYLWKRLLGYHGNCLFVVAKSYKKRQQRIDYKGNPRKWQFCGFNTCSKVFSFYLYRSIWRLNFNVLHNNVDRWGNISIKCMAFLSLENGQKRNLFCELGFCELGQSGNAIFVPSTNICAYTYTIMNIFWGWHILLLMK